MADLSDVTAYIATQVSAAVYPNGSSSPSIAPIYAGFTAPMDVRIFEGWPISDQIDNDVGGTILSGAPPVKKPRPNGPCANISIFPMAGTGNTIYQIQDKTYVVTPVVLGLTVVVVGNAITITGTPNTGEFVTIEADRQFIYSELGATASAILAALLTDAQVNYPAATLVGSTLTVPAVYALLVRQGGVGLLGKVTHRQCQYVMVTVWAPDHKTRSVLSAAVDVAIKNNIIVTLPDGTDAKIVYSRTNVSDEAQNVTIYRRDLVYEIDYATMETFQGVTVTSVTTTLAAGEYEFSPPPQVPIIS